MKTTRSITACAVWAVVASLPFLVQCASLPSGGGGAAPPGAVLATIPVGRAPTYLAMTPDGTRVFAASADGSLRVIDTAGNSVLATLSSDPDPSGIGVTPNGAWALMTNLLSVRMAVLDTASNTMRPRITLLGERFTGGFGRIAALPDNNTAWVANQANEVLAIVRLDTSQVVGRDIDMRPVDIALSPDGSLAYVAGCKQECVPGTVEIISTAQKLTQGYIEVGPRPYRIAMAPGGATFYTTNLADSSLSVVDVGAGAVVATVQIGVEPTGLAVARDGSVVYTTSQQLGTVTAVDAVTHAIRNQVRVGDQAREIVVTPDGQRVYVSTRDNVVALATQAFANPN